MTWPPDHVTAVEAALARRRRIWRPVTLVLVLVKLGIVAALIVGLILAARLLGGDSTPYFDDDAEHFKYGSIGAEPASGLPYDVWQALPALFPEEFGGRDDYAAFGFLYETDADGTRRDLPIGISRREVSGVELVWFNCALCHVGTYRTDPEAAPQIVAGMPSNNLQLGRFIDFVLGIADDPRLAPEPLMAAMAQTGADHGPLDRLVWRLAVLPRLREELLQRQAVLGPLMAAQPAWGPGRVDTFNPYKIIQFGMPFRDFAEAERIGVADLPSVFLQGPREGMFLHWDGNNPSLAERNLSAALGAGVTPETVDHWAIERVAAWLADLPPPPSPAEPDMEALTRGQEIYKVECAACHGYRGEDGYVFEGALLGQVVPIGEIGTDRARLDSYTEEFSARQRAELFAGTPYRFRSFRKTEGYANHPLDGLWLRGPYLHNGSVPTLAALLAAPRDRPETFLRGSDLIDSVSGGFVAPPCDPEAVPQSGFCFDTSGTGNGKGGHLYGTGLADDQKADLLAYLGTF